MALVIHGGIDGSRTRKSNARFAESLDEEHDADADADAEDAWAAEVAARIDAVRAGTAETITTAEALAQARTRLTARRC
jgi:Putative addiction module component